MTFERHTLDTFFSQICFYSIHYRIDNIKIKWYWNRISFLPLLLASFFVATDVVFAFSPCLPLRIIFALYYTFFFAESRTYFASSCQEKSLVILIDISNTYYDIINKKSNKCYSPFIRILWFDLIKLVYVAHTYLKT